MKNLAIILSTLLCAAPGFAQGGPIEGAPAGIEEDARLITPDTELIDMPTASVLDLGGFYSKTRFFSSGGVLEFLAFGVYPRVNLGASINGDRVIGTSDPMRIRRPELQFKFRFFDGDRLLPAIALGFDSQGWLYSQPIKDYNQQERGFYMIGSQEIGVPGLQLHMGWSISDFDQNDIGGMIASSWNIQDKVLVMMEWDNINSFVKSRLNAGTRFYVTPNFNIEFSLRGIGQGGRFSNGVKRGPERIAQFKYTGNF
jgi:hypothetical protein